MYADAFLEGVKHSLCWNWLSAVFDPETQGKELTLLLDPIMCMKYRVRWKTPLSLLGTGFTPISDTKYVWGSPLPPCQPILQVSRNQLGVLKFSSVLPLTTQHWCRPHRLRAQSHKTFSHFRCQSQGLGLLNVWPAGCKVMWESEPITSIF